MISDLEPHRFAERYREEARREVVISTLAAQVERPRSQKRRRDMHIRELLDDMEVGVILHDSGTIIEFNKRVPELFDSVAHELRGNHLKDLVTPASLLRLVNWLESNGHEPVLVLAVRGRAQSFFLRLKRLASIPYCGRRVQVTALHELAEESSATTSSFNLPSISTVGLNPRLQPPLPPR
jgi:PAS domain-containing protein